MNYPPLPTFNYGWDTLQGPRTVDVRSIRPGSQAESARLLSEFTAFVRPEIAWAVGRPRRLRFTELEESPFRLSILSPAAALWWTFCPKVQILVIRSHTLSHS
jgi:uncharacterized protein YqcC (DUF446 family)